MKRKIIFVIGLLIISTGYYFLNLKFNIGIPCIFYKITNFYCPGCGLTRMIVSLTKLEFYQAFRYNPLVFILLIVSGIYYAYHKILKKQIKINNKLTYFLLIIVILFGILRNIPIFDFLQPTEL